MLYPGARALLHDVGISLTSVLRRAGLPEELLAAGPVALAADDYFRFWQAIDDESPGTTVAIDIARAITAEAFDPPLFAGLCSRNLNLAAARIARYKPLIGPMTVSIQQTRESTTLAYGWPPGMHPPRPFALVELLFWVALARLGTRTEVRPLRITAPRMPSNLTQVQDFAGVPITEGPAETITFSTPDAERPFLTENTSMWRFFAPELDRRLSEIRSDSPMSERVRAALIELLPTGTSKITAVARRLGTSTRVLQRQLQLEDTSYLKTLSTTREALARHYLSHANMSAAEVAFLLAYEEPNSFYRAFRTWTGETPEQVRRALTPVPDNGNHPTDHRSFD